MQFLLKALPTLLTALLCMGVSRAEPASLPVDSEIAQLWPWMALSAILMLLFVIAGFARRRSRFGKR